MISAPGIGSGLDINGLVSQLLEAEAVPKSNLMNQKEARLQAKLSGFGLLKSAISEIGGSLTQLKNIDNYSQRSAVSSDSDFFTATADTTAALSSHSIRVDRLAQNHKLASADFASAASIVGSGELVLTAGDDNLTLTIDAGNNTLTGIRDAINNASGNTFVSASILNIDDGVGGTTSKLVLSSKDTAVSLKLTVDDADSNDTDTSGLSTLAFDAGVTENMQELQAAQTSLVYIDTLAISSKTNVVKDAIQGVTITLSDADPAVTNTLEISKDSTGATGAVQNFVDRYNGLMSTLANLKGSGSADDIGVLLGDASIRNLESQIRRVISGDSSSAAGSLVELGVTTQNNGQLKLDAEVLKTKLSSDAAAVSDYFAADQGLVARMDSLVKNYLDTGGILQARSQGLNAQIDNISEQRERLSTRLVSVERRLRAQFNAMDALVASLNNTGGFLQQQLDGLANLGRQISNRN